MAEISLGAWTAPYQTNLEVANNQESLVTRLRRASIDIDGDSYRGWENPATPALMSISSLGIRIDARLCAEGAGLGDPGAPQPGGGQRFFARHSATLPQAERDRSGE